MYTEKGIEDPKKEAGEFRKNRKTNKNNILIFYCNTKTTLNVNKYRKNKKNNKFSKNSDFLKGKGKEGHLEA